MLFKVKDNKTFIKQRSSFIFLHNDVFCLIALLVGCAFFSFLGCFFLVVLLLVLALLFTMLLFALALFFVLALLLVLVLPSHWCCCSCWHKKILCCFVAFLALLHCYFFLHYLIALLTLPCYSFHVALLFF